MEKHLHKRIRAVLCAAAMMITLTPWDGLDAQAEDTYLVRDPFYNFNSGYNYYESEHFQFIWGNSGNAGQVTQAFLEGNARNMEECWDIYMEDLGMAPPCESVEEYLRDGNKYKTNIYLSGTGLANMTDDWAYMSWDSGGFAYMFCDVGAMVYDPPSWVLPHEFGHVITAHQLGWNRNKYSGSWWEALANWFREEWLYATGNTVGHGTDFFETYLKSSSLTFPCGRDYYAAWPFMIYLTENPDQLEGFGQYFVRDMLQQGQVDEYPLTMIERLTPQTNFKDTLGHYAKRMATFDLEHQDAYRARLNELLAQGSWNWQQIYTMLEQVDGTQNVYSVPTERAPQAAGLNLIPLTITGSEISVTFHGLTNVKGADWRACIVQEDANGVSTYSDLFRDGETVTMAVGANTTAAYLTVIATPDSDTYVPCGLAYQGSEFAEENCSFRSKTQYPYEVVLNGAVPMERRIHTYVGGHSHANGGGFVADTANVADTAYVGPDAMVLGYATVSDHAVITDHAVVEGGARISGNAAISGYGMVCENGSVSGNAIVSDYGLVMGQATVSGNAKVIESACVYGTYSLKDDAVAKGISFCMYNGSASGQGMVDGDYYDDGGKTVTKGTAFGWVCAQSYVDALPYTDGLYMSYDFNSDSSLCVTDRYTSTYATAKNSPLWESVRTSANGVLTFDGSSQYVELDRSLTYMTDTEIQFAALWKGGAANQNLFYLGDQTRFMRFTPMNGNGLAEFTISDGGELQTLTAPALTAGEWSTVRIILSGDNATLKINGETVGTGAITIDPKDVAGDGSIDGGWCGYLGRGYDGNYFKGSVDFFSVYFKEATEPDYYYTEKEEADSELPEEESRIYGDVDCNQQVDIVDVVLLARFVSQDPDLSADAITEQGKINANVNLDENIDADDITMIIMYLGGLIAPPVI